MIDSSGNKFEFSNLIVWWIFIHIKWENILIQSSDKNTAYNKEFYKKYIIEKCILKLAIIKYSVFSEYKLSIYKRVKWKLLRVNIKSSLHKEKVFLFPFMSVWNDGCSLNLKC